MVNHPIPRSVESFFQFQCLNEDEHWQKRRVSTGLPPHTAIKVFGDVRFCKSSNSRIQTSCLSLLPSCRSLMLARMVLTISDPCLKASSGVYVISLRKLCSVNCTEGGPRALAREGQGRREGAGRPSWINHCSGTKCGKQ
jgi:hypothetical protein